MGNPNSNQMRAFADVVSIEAWHEEFGKGCTRADLHADVVFSTARMGGEDDSKVRFRLSVKRAELVVIIPETEPVSVDPKSVSRDTINPSIQRKIKTNYEQNASVSGELKASASVQALTAAASVGAKGEASTSKKEETSLTIDFNGFNVQHRKDADGNHTWVIEGEGGQKLQGKPWAGEEKPRLTLVDKRTNPDASLPPAVRVEIRCLREDLEISDIELKENEGWAKNLTDGQRAKKLKAAEAYIRTKLEEEGLSSVKMDESFAQIVMAHITADSV